MICKGGCGNEATFGKWCCEKWTDCPGYKKKLSDKAKLRGNNGSRGILSKKYDKKDFKTKAEVEFVCDICGDKYKKVVLVAFVKDRCNTCPSCLKKKVKMSLKNLADVKRDKKISLWLSGKLSGNNNTFGSSGFVRYHLMQIHDSKCSLCGWNKKNPRTGNVPLHVHHKDGNQNNNHIDNLELLCPNCHSITDNYGSLNKGRGNPRIRRSKKEQYYKKKEEALLDKQ